METTDTASQAATPITAASSPVVAYIDRSAIEAIERELVADDSEN